MDLPADYIHDWNDEVSQNQVLLCYVPAINQNSFVHVAFWHGSFEIRDYLRTGAAKLRDSKGVTLQDIIRNASTLVLRVKGRANVAQEAVWCELVSSANTAYLGQARTVLPRHAGTPNSATLQAGVSGNLPSIATYYGLTAARAARIANRVSSLDDVANFGQLAEDSAVILYFVLLDLGRQAKLGVPQRSANGKWRDFHDIFADVKRNQAYGQTLLTQLPPFHTVDPYQHIMTFELQLNNNAAIGNPATKTNQADVVIVDLVHKLLYVVEAKLHTPLDERQLEESAAALHDLTVNNQKSVFFGFKPRLVVLDRSRRVANVADMPVDTITWDEIAAVLRRAHG